MRNTLKAIGGFGIAILFPLALVLIAVLLIQGGVWLSAALYPWLLTISGITLLVTVFVLLPNAFFSSTPTFAGTGLKFASYVFGATLWVWSLLLTYTLWGGLGLFIGLFMAGLGIVPLAILATLFNAMWSQLGQLVLLLIMTIVMRGWGHRLRQQGERSRKLRGRPGSESRDHEQLRRQVEAAQSLTTAYSKILQTPRDHFWPLSALPASRETMKTALKVDAAYQASQGELDKPIGGGSATLRDGFVISYASLADFVPDDLAARISPYWKFMRMQGGRAREGEPFDEMAVARALTELAPSEEDKQASEKAQGEWATLADEMGAYLDRIAPRKKP